MEKKLFIGGIGGQGVVFCGKILGLAAVEADKYATSYSEYAPAMRNGYTYTTVAVSSKEISAQVALSYDYMAFFEDSSCSEQSRFIKKEGIIIANSSLVKNIPNVGQRENYLINGSELALELGDSRLLNVIMLGAVIKATKIMELSQIEKVLEEKFGRKPEVLKLNIESLYMGAATVEKVVVS